MLIVWRRLCKTFSSVVCEFGGHITEARRTLDRASGDCAHNHTDLNRLFLPVTHGVRAKSVTESLDNPTFCGGTHSGFQRDRCSDCLSENSPLVKGWYVGAD